MMTAATMLFASSCSKEQISTSIPVGEQVTVTLTADLGAIGSRAIADGLKVNEVAWAIYVEGADTPLTDLQGVLPINDKQGTLEVRLVTGKSYDIALFAYSTENPATAQTLTIDGAVTAPSYYQVDWNNKQVTVLYPDGQIANDTDARDCYWHVEQDLKVNGPVAKTFTLTRPLAQLNFGATVADTEAAADAGMVVNKSKIVASTYTQFNMFTGKCLGETAVEYTFAANTIPDQALTVQGTDYTYLGTTYLLVDERMTQDISLTIYDQANTEINTISYTYVPFERNYRTNIIGSLLTDPVDFSIVVDEEFKKPDYDLFHWDGTSKAITPDANGVYNVTEAAELAWIAAQVNSGQNDFNGKSVVIPAGVEGIDINSQNGQVWTPIGTTDNPFNGNFDGNNVPIRNVAIKTTECAGLFGCVIGSVANVNLQNVTIEAGHYAGAVAGYAYGNITGCSVDGLTMVVTPYDTTRAAYDNGDKVGGIVGYVGEKSGTAGYVINNNSVVNATITAYRDLGGIAGAAYLAEFKGNSVKDSSLTVDQTVNNYGTKDANLGELVGRVLSGSVNKEENTIEKVTLTWNPESLRPCIENVIAAGEKTSTTAKGYVLATSSNSFLLADETGWIMVYQPKNYSTAMPAVGDVVSVTGKTSLYPSAKPNMLQFAQNTVVTVLDEPKVEVTHPTSDVWTVEQIEAYAQSPIRTFGTLKGKLNINTSNNTTHYNIDIEGTQKQGTILAPKAEIKSQISNDGLNGKTIQVSGYLTYLNSSKYVSMIITDFVDCKQATEWGIVGDMTSWGTNPDITMYTYGDGVMFAKGVEIAEGQSFKIRANNEWNDAKNYGMESVSNVYINMEFPVITGPGSMNIKPLENGKFDIYFNLKNKKVYVMEVGEPMEDALPYKKYEEPLTWRITGSFNGWNPADDNYKMTLTEDGKWATISATFDTNAELKFVANGSWDINVGNGVTVESGKVYDGYQGGGNIIVPAGSYLISLSMENSSFKFDKIGGGSDEPNGPVETEGGRDDFGTIAKTSSSYASGKTTAGWNYVNSAVMSGGSNDNNPVFNSLLGSSTSTKGLTINGKTSGKGKITSPVINTGCHTLSLDYGYCFKESNGVDFQVNILQNGEAVQSYQIKDKTLKQLAAATWTQEILIEGDFQIEITNNSPSKSTSNKDRYTIFNIVWTGYAK